MTEGTGIYNFLRIDDNITTSGQPDEVKLTELRDMGVMHIINLGLHDHEKALPNEVATVLGLGMDYIHIPVQFSNPTEEDFEQFCVVLDTLKDEKIHIHCIANYRVTAFLYRYLRDVLGMNDADARAPMDKIWQPNEVWAEFVKPH